MRRHAGDVVSYVIMRADGVLVAPITKDGMSYTPDLARALRFPDEWELNAFVRRHHIDKATHTAEEVIE